MKNKITHIITAACLVLASFFTLYSCSKKSTDACAGVSCLHGGVCNKGQCTCPTGYSGTYCENMVSTDKCASVTCQNGGVCVDGKCSCPTGYTGANCETKTTTGGGNTSLIYKNNSFTGVTITVNGNTQIIPALGGTYTFTGTAGSTATGSAFTYGVSSTLRQIGLKMEWTISTTFPSSGSQRFDLNVSASYFYLKMKNSSAYSINSYYVNKGLTTELYQLFSVPNDGITYGLGYYYAYTNSNVTGVLSNSSTVVWNPLSLPMTQNQSVILSN